MTFYSVMEQAGAAVIFETKRQMVAAQEWMKKADAEMKNYKTPEGRKAVKAELIERGLTVVQARANKDGYRHADFYIPLPGQEYLLRGFVY